MKTFQQLCDELEDAEIAYHNDIYYAEHYLSLAEEAFDEGKRKLGL